MAINITFICDNCEKEMENEQALILTDAKTDNHFCGLECLKHWIDEDESDQPNIPPIPGDNNV